MTMKGQSRAEGQNDKKVPPKDRPRKKPGSTGKGEYYHIEVRPKGEFVAFHTQDVDEPGHVQRVAGKNPSGSWKTVKWLIEKGDAHVNGGKLVPDSRDAKDLMKKLGSQPVHMVGDRFKASPR